MLREIRDLLGAGETSRRCTGKMNQITANLVPPKGGWIPQAAQPSIDQDGDREGNRQQEDAPLADSMPVDTHLAQSTMTCGRCGHEGWHHRYQPGCTGGGLLAYNGNLGLACTCEEFIELLAHELELKFGPAEEREA